MLVLERKLDGHIARKETDERREIVSEWSLDDKDDFAKARAYRIVRGVLEKDVVTGPKGLELLRATEASAQSGRKDDQRGPCFVWRHYCRATCAAATTPAASRISNRVAAGAHRTLVQKSRIRQSWDMNVRAGRTNTDRQRIPGKKMAMIFVAFSQKPLNLFNDDTKSSNFDHCHVAGSGGVST
jgi:hypothetical protein